MSGRLMVYGQAYENHKAVIRMIKRIIRFIFRRRESLKHMYYEYSYSLYKEFYDGRWG